MRTLITLLSCRAKFLIIFLGLFGIASGVNAGPILSATSAQINSGGPGSGSINDTLNQNGLAIGYTSGVTDFDSYIASNPSHTSTYSGFEWFSNPGSNSASVTYNLGSLQTIDALALWNEEAAGIGVLDLFTSTDGINFSVLSLGLSPTDNSPYPAPYFADVFSFSPISTQYIRFDMSACPQQPANYTSCAIGEVAFRQGQSNVPEPSAITLLGLGLAGIGFSRKKKTA